MPPVELTVALRKRPRQTTRIHSTSYCCSVSSVCMVFALCLLSRQQSSSAAAAAFSTPSFTKTLPIAQSLSLFLRQHQQRVRSSGISTVVWRRRSTSSEMTTESSSSSSSSKFNNNNQKPRRMLIDVDCNLWHRDLPSLLLPTTECDDDDEQQKNLPLQFRILRQDALENVRAVLAPSSTLREAASGLAALREYNDYLLESDNSSGDGSDGLSSSSSSNNLLPKVKTTVGIHPYHVLDEELQGKDVEEHLETIQELLSQHKDACAAVGECGLDASDGFPPLLEQIPWFAAQVALAELRQLPLFVHERLAFDETMELLEDATTAVIIHCFTGTVEQCRAYVERGYSISLSGYIFRDDAGAVRQCLEENVIPLDKLLIETDAPYMGFDGCREAFCDKNADFIRSKLNSKKRKKLISSQYPNAPSSLEKVLLKVLHHINVGRSKRGEEPLSETELADHTSNNANQFFQFGLA